MGIALFMVYGYGYGYGYVGGYGYGGGYVYDYGGGDCGTASSFKAVQLS